MKNTYQSININAPIDEIWDIVHDFHDFSWAPEVITSCVPQGDKNGVEIGAQRILNDVFRETLLELNHETHTIRYSIDDGPSPISKREVSNYIGHLHLSPGTKDTSTFVEWLSSWESDSDEGVKFCHDIYVSLLNSLADKMEQKQNV